MQVAADLPCFRLRCAEIIVSDGPGKLITSGWSGPQSPHPQYAPNLVIAIWPHSFECTSYYVTCTSYHVTRSMPAQSVYVLPLSLQGATIAKLMTITDCGKMRGSPLFSKNCC